MNAAQIARVLSGIPTADGGFICRCPVPTHGSGRGDRRPSLSIKDGHTRLLVLCFAGCNSNDVLAELRRRGLLEEAPGQHPQLQTTARRNLAEPRERATDAKETARALATWSDAKQLGGLAQKYFHSRGIHELSLPDIDGVLRFHPRCPFGVGERHPCIIGLWTDAITNEARAIHRTALTPGGQKKSRMSLGPTAGCVLRLWPDELVTVGLVIGEGLETVLAAATRIEHGGALLRPAWAAGDRGHLAKFPVLAGIEALTILVDNDVAGQSAARECKERWLAAGREVTALTPRDLGKDFNEIVQKDSCP